MIKSSLQRTILFCIAGGIIFILLTIIPFPIPCIWKTLFGIPCPGCGLTRAFRLIFQFRFLEAEQTNILSIPLFLCIIIVFITSLIEYFTKKTVMTRIYVIVSKKPFIFIAIAAAVASEIYNIINKI